MRAFSRGRTLFLLFALLSAYDAEAQSVKWRQNWSEAALESQSTQRPLLLQFSTTWCPHCSRMQQTYAHPSVAAEVNRLFIPVLIDADRDPELVQWLRPVGYPTTAILRSDRTLAGTIVGYQDTQQLLPLLNKAHGNAAFSRSSTPMVQAAPPTPVVQRQPETPKLELPALPESRSLTERVVSDQTDPSWKKRENRVDSAASERPAPALTLVPADEPPSDLTPALARLNSVRDRVDTVQGKRRSSSTASTLNTDTPAGHYCLVSLLDERVVRHGSDTVSTVHEGSRYYFTSARHRDRFLAEPSRYIPAHKGQCVVTLASKVGELQPGDPRFSAVHRGRLYFFADDTLRRRFVVNPTAFVE